MPVADERLSSLQVLKLLQAVHNKDTDNIRKLVQHGLPNLVNYAGKKKLCHSLIIFLLGYFNVLL